jgi:hypothetical protein
MAEDYSKIAISASNLTLSNTETVGIGGAVVAMPAVSDPTFRYVTSSVYLWMPSKGSLASPTHPDV